MNDRPKKSWREQDASRDKSRSGSGSSGPAPQSKKQEREQEVASKQYRAQLDALFEKGGLAEFAEKLKLGTPKDLRNEPAPVKTIAHVPEEPKVPLAENPKYIARKKLQESIGRGDISRAFDKYEKAYGMPDDWELLEMGLEHQKEDRQQEVLAAIGALIEKKGAPRRSRGLASKLRFLEETSELAEIRDVAATLRTKLG